jgi:hypothetical protein
MAITAGAKVSSWWGYGMPRPLCWIWHKTHWMLTGNAGYSRCWCCGKCHRRNWVDDLWPDYKIQSSSWDDKKREGFYV